jgi:hypothetical protein
MNFVTLHNAPLDWVVATSHQGEAPIVTMLGTEGFTKLAADALRESGIQAIALKLDSVKLEWR